jgi:DNA-binding cell septation regulator SpoVG
VPLTCMIIAINSQTTRNTRVSEITHDAAEKFRAALSDIQAAIMASPMAAETEARLIEHVSHRGFLLVDRMEG